MTVLSVYDPAMCCSSKGPPNGYEKLRSFKIYSESRK